MYRGVVIGQRAVGVIGLAERLEPFRVCLVMSLLLWRAVELPEPSEVRFAIAAFASAQRASAAVMNSSFETPPAPVVVEDV